MKAGDVLTVENLRVIRPRYRLAPKYYDPLLRRRVSRDSKKEVAVDRVSLAEQLELESRGRG
jgi:sialic acid synthase SpsE